jgi:hypothetical protein
MGMESKMANKLDSWPGRETLVERFDVEPFSDFSAK